MKKCSIGLFAAVLCLTLTVAGYALQTTVDRDLNIVIPNLKLGDRQYEVYLDLVASDAGPPELSWHLTSLLPAAASEAPVTLDANLGIHIPNLTFLGFNFEAQLAFNSDPANIPEPGWALNTELFFEVAGSLRNLQQETTVPVEDAATLQDGLNTAAFSLYHGLKTLQQLAGQESDFFFSPYSVVQSLAMVYAGARGPTAVQMQDVLHYNLPQTELHTALNALNHELAQRGAGERGASGPFPFFPSGFRLNVANSFWAVRSPLQDAVLRRESFNPEYLDTLAVNYGEGVRFLNLLGLSRQDREDLGRQINNWTRRATQREIQQAITADQIDNNTSLLLTSAIYYNASWKRPFARTRTDNEPFNGLDGHRKIVSMMNQENTFRHYSGADFDAVEIMYAGEELSMLIFLPHEGRFRQVEARLDRDLMQTTLNGMGDEKVIRLLMPRWQTISLNDMSGVLRYLGLTDLFSAGVADLSGMNAAHNLALGQLAHSATITVNEDGTRAAAATEATNVSGLETPLFKMERPFMYIIRDVPTTTILFMGRVVKP